MLKKITFLLLVCLMLGIVIGIPYALNNRIERNEAIETFENGTIEVKTL